MQRFANPTFWIILVAMLFLSRGNILQDPAGWLLQEMLMLPAIIIGLTVHEFAHAIAAYKLGDPTPKWQGRLTLNPLAHIDIFGFVALILAGFGWGKAVEINPYNFKNRRRDEFLVSIAGVVMNLIVIIIFALIFKFALGNLLTYNNASIYIIEIIVNIIMINIMLMLFNLLPIPPLDGFSIITEIFDLRRKPWYYTVYNNGFIILIFFIMMGGTTKILRPLINSIAAMIFI